MSRDARRGIFVLIAVSLFCIAAIYSQGEPQLRYVVTFEDAAYLDIGDSIYLKGVDVGEVRDIDLTDQLTIRVTVQMRDRFRKFITRNLSHVVIFDKLLFGRKAILLDPVGESEPLIQPGEVIQGTDSYPAHIVDKGAEGVGALFQALQESISSGFRRHVLDRIQDRIQDSGSGPKSGSD